MLGHMKCADHQKAVVGLRFKVRQGVCLADAELKLLASFDHQGVKVNAMRGHLLLLQQL